MAIHMYVLLLHSKIMQDRILFPLVCRVVNLPTPTPGVQDECVSDAVQSRADNITTICGSLDIFTVEEVITIMVHATSPLNNKHFRTSPPS